MSDPLAPVEFEVTEDEEGTRIDRVLAARLPAVSRTAVQRWMDAGRVEVDGEVVLPKAKARAGSSVWVLPEPPEPTDVLPEDIPLTVVHEDEDLLVIDKPAGLVVHPAPGHPRGTLVNAVLYHLGARGPGELHRPGIVHRLDKDTSGVMVVAKTPAAHEGLVAQFQIHAIERRYEAVVLGEPPDRITYDTLHGRHPHDRKRFSGRVERGRRAVTHVEVLERFGGATRVACRLETGRTHQIRVHLSEAGFPLLADGVYGRVPATERLREAATRIGRQALHAALLGFTHPRSGAELSFERPPPDDFRTALSFLRAA